MKIELLSTKKVIVMEFLTLSDNQMEADPCVCNHCTYKSFCKSRIGIEDFCDRLSHQLGKGWREEFTSYPSRNFREAIEEAAKNPVKEIKRLD